MSAAPPQARARPPQQVAIGLIRDAEAYRLAAVRVVPKRPPLYPASDPHLLAPAWHLLCHASELALKAYLLSGGADQSAKKGGLMHSAIRHNLNGLYQLAVEHGFEPPDEEFGDLIEFLDPYHAAHVFRYREEGRMPYVPPAVIADILEPVIVGISQTVRQRWMALRKCQEDPDLRDAGLARACPPSDKP